MNILAIETATADCSVAILSNNNISFLEDIKPHSHTKTLLPMVDDLLNQRHLNLEDLDAIAFDSGPGSFTGLRIGAGVVQGLALANDTPIIKIPSLNAMAQQSVGANIAVALDARMNEVYFATFQNKIQIGKTEVLPIDTIKLDLTTDWVLVGNGWVEYGISEKYQHYSSEFHVMPHAKAIVRLAKNTKQHSLENAIPNYVRAV